MPAATATPDNPRIEALRRFNRFYTRRIGVLHEGLLDTEFTLAESRLLWELAHGTSTTASELARTLDLDAGYLSRLLRGLKERGLIRSVRSKSDARALELSLSAAGRRAFAPLDERSRTQAGALLGTLDEARQQQLLQSMAHIERALDDPRTRRAPTCLLRAHRPGDIGWIIARHGALYAQEYGFDSRFEALVARIGADFLERFDPAREACWIAERDGVNVGCVVLVQARDEKTQAIVEGAAQLRLLIVEPGARGLGLGERLVSECERFAREKGYRRLVLWTNRNLDAARAIYRKAGYRLTASEAHHSFGHDLVGETWELALR
jgi:DNA-binding MarR family transcriptional regulator/N-acetylglutamate synthase-like GNAT family acetyltransferase